MEDAPLQLYMSALVFSPSNSLVRELFENEASHWVQKLPITEADWDACEQTLENNPAWAASVAFSADGQRLRAGLKDGTVQVWDVVTGACIQTLDHQHSEWFFSVAFSADGRRMASGSEDGVVSLWDTADGACRLTLQGHNDKVISLVFSADGQQFASASRNGDVKVWNAVTGVCVHTHHSAKRRPTIDIFFGDVPRFALTSGTNDELITIWDASTGTCTQTLRGHTEHVASVAFSADGVQLASATRNAIKIWNVATGVCSQTLDGVIGNPGLLTFSADGWRIAAGLQDGIIQLWDKSMSTCIQTLNGHFSSIQAMSFSKDGQRLASGSSDGSIRVWDVATTVAKIQTSPLAHRGPVSLVTFQEEGRLLVTSSDADETVKIWNVAACACIQTLDGDDGHQTRIGFSADDRHVAFVTVGDGYLKCKVWDVATGASIQTLKVPVIMDPDDQYPISGVIFSEDSRRLAITSRCVVGTTMTIWEVATGICLQTLKSRDSHYLLAFSPGGERLTSTAGPGELMVWDIATGACIQTLEIKGEKPCSVAFTADCGWLALLSYDATIKIYEVLKGTCVQTLILRDDFDHISFDGTFVGAVASTTFARLSTNVGALALHKSWMSHSSSETQEGLSWRVPWIMKDSKRWLWLPKQYRYSLMDVSGSTLALGDPLGRLIILEFNDDESGQPGAGVKFLDG